MCWYRANAALVSSTGTNRHPRAPNRNSDQILVSPICSSARQVCRAARRARSCSASAPFNLPSGWLCLKAGDERRDRAGIPREPRIHVSQAAKTTSEHPILKITLDCGCLLSVSSLGSPKQTAAQGTLQGRGSSARCSVSITSSSNRKWKSACLRSLPVTQSLICFISTFTQ